MDDFDRGCVTLSQWWDRLVDATFWLWAVPLLLCSLLAYPFIWAVGRWKRRTA